MFTPPPFLLILVKKKALVRPGANEGAAAAAGSDPEAPLEVLTVNLALGGLSIIFSNDTRAPGIAAAAARRERDGSAASQQAASQDLPLLRLDISAVGTLVDFFVFYLPPFFLFLLRH